MTFDATKNYPVIRLEKQGENLARKIDFDISSWIADYGSGTLVLLHQRSEDSGPYTVSMTIGTDGIATWKPTAADMQYAGDGMLQLYYTVDTVIVKSVVYRTLVTESLGQGSTPPSPIQPWIDEIIEARDRAETAADEAEAAEEAIENMTASASVDANVGTPSVTVTKTETSESFNLDFEFENLKGTPGDSGVYVGSDTPPDTANVWVNPEGEVEDKFISYKSFFEDGETDMDDDINETSLCEYNGCIYHFDDDNTLVKGYNGTESRTWSVGTSSDSFCAFKILNGKLIVLAANNLYYATLPSDDTLPSASWTWTTVALPSGVYADSIFYCNNEYLLYGRLNGQQSIYTSSDLSNWTLEISGIVNSLAWFVYVDGYYYALRSNQNAIYYTADLSSGFSSQSISGGVTNVVEAGGKVYVWSGNCYVGYINTSHGVTLLSQDAEHCGDEIFYDAKNNVFISSGYADRGATLVLGYSKDAVNWCDIERSTSSVWTRTYGYGCVDESTSSYHADNIVLSYWDDDNERGVMTVNYDTEAEGFYNSVGDSLNYIVKNVVGIPGYSTTDANKVLGINSSGTQLEFKSASLSTKYVHNIFMYNTSGDLVRISALLINTSATAITTYSGLVSALTALGMPSGSQGIPASGMYDTTFGSFQRFAVASLIVNSSNLVCTAVEQTVSGSAYQIIVPSSNLTIADFVYAI